MLYSAIEKNMKYILRGNLSVICGPVSIYQVYTRCEIIIFHSGFSGALANPFSADAYSGRSEVINLINPECSIAEVLNASALWNCSSSNGDILTSFNDSSLAAVRCDGMHILVVHHFQLNEFLYIAIEYTCMSA